MDKLEGIYQDLVVTGVEITALAVAIILINVIVRMIFARVRSVRVLTKHQKRVQYVRARIQLTLLLVFLGVAGSIAIINGYLIYEGHPVLESSLNWINQISPTFWTQLGLGMIKLVTLLIVVPLATRWIRRVLAKIEMRAKAFEQVKANDKSIEAFFHSLDRMQTNGIWFFVAWFATWVMPLPEAVARWMAIGLKIYLIGAIGLLVVQAVAAIVDSLDALGQKYAHSQRPKAIYSQLRRLIPLLRRCLEYIAYVLVAMLVTLQLEYTAGFAQYGPRLVQVIGIFFLARVAVEMINLLVDRSLLKPDDLSDTQCQRRHTLAPIVKSLLSYAAFFFAFVLMLRALRFDPMPILAGAGIFGIVLGLGAQPLINDIVSGFFILFEDLFLVGDFIETGSAEGVVEAIHIRTTRIRNPDGQLHLMRNGQLGDIVNFSKTYTFAVIEVGVAYDTDLDHAYRVLGDAGLKLKETNDEVLEATQIQGLENFGESDLLIRTVTRVKPGCHRQVSRDLRKLIKEAFDQEGIEIPFARRVIIFKNAEGDSEPLMPLPFASS